MCACVSVHENVDLQFILHTYCRGETKTDGKGSHLHIVVHLLMITTKQ